MISRAAYALANAPLDPTRAWAVLRPYWDEVVREYHQKGFLQPASVRVDMDEKWHDSCRHFAAMDKGATTLCLSPALADMDETNIRGVLAHEAGHIVDFSNPGRYWFRPALSVPVREGARVVSVLDVEPTFKGDVLFWFERLPTKGLAKHMRDWEQDRTRDEEERLADAIASWVMGQRVGYTGPTDCLIEALGAGVPRPKGLR